MSYCFAILLSIFVIDPAKVARINKAKTAAQKAYEARDFKTAIARYKYLRDSLHVAEDEIALNLGNAYFQANDTTNAASTFQGLAMSENKTIRSQAAQQLGVLHHRQGKMEEALANFKQALKADPANADARYNYELLKKKLDEKNKKDQEDKKKRQEPSAYAKRLKAQADRLAAQFKFAEAAALMTEGAKKDQSVMYYEDFMNRLNTVADINQQK